MNNKYQKAKNDAIGQIPEWEDDPGNCQLRFNFNDFPNSLWDKFSTSDFDFRLGLIKQLGRQLG